MVAAARLPVKLEHKGRVQQTLRQVRDENAGLQQEYADEVARLNAEGGDVTRRVVCSFVQVYREQVLDLLNPATAAQGQGLRGLKLKWSRERDFFVDNLFVEEVRSAPPIGGAAAPGGGANMSAYPSFIAARR